jgi:hypothetical protein
MSELKDEIIEQQKMRIVELETTLNNITESALNVITYWRNKYEAIK